MHHDHHQAIRTVQDLGLRLERDETLPVDVSVHPPFTDLRSVQTVLEDRGIPVLLGAQHCFHEDQGAFTGEVSPVMLAKLGVSIVIVGHSERRQLFGETDAAVAATLRAVLRHGMTPIVCVGETEEERDGGVTDERLTAQVTAALSGLPAETIAGLVLAYEPIWAIGTGRAASAADAQAACSHIRGVVAGLANAEAAQKIRIQYGGSVKPENTEDLLAEPDIDGALVGGASLDASQFAAIAKSAASLARHA
jgi:triosephosphate isomerase